MKALDLLLKSASYEENGLLAKIAAKKNKKNKGPAQKRNKGTLIRDTDTAYVGNANKVKEEIKKTPELWGGANFKETPKTTETTNWANFGPGEDYQKNVKKMDRAPMMRKIKTGAKAAGALGILGGLGYAGYKAVKSDDKAS